MAMRDPGTPGRNPFFDHGPDAELGDVPDEPDDADAAAVRPIRSDDGSDAWADDPDFRPGLGGRARRATRSARWPRSSTRSRARSPRRPSTSSRPRTSSCSR